MMIHGKSEDVNVSSPLMTKTTLVSIHYIHTYEQDNTAKYLNLFKAFPFVKENFTLNNQSVMYAAHYGISIMRINTGKYNKKS